MNKTVAIGATLAAALALAVGAYLVRCRPEPKVTETSVVDGKMDGSWGSTATMQRKVEKKRGASIRERYDPKTGLLVERLTLGEMTTVIGTQRDSTASGTVHETVREVVVKVTDPWRPSSLGITAAAEWNGLHLNPDAFRIGADVPVGDLLGLHIRAGLEARFTDGPVPSGAGITVRVEF